MIDVVGSIAYQAGSPDRIFSGWSRELSGRRRCKRLMRGQPDRKVGQATGGLYVVPHSLVPGAPQLCCGKPWIRSYVSLSHRLSP